MESQCLYIRISEVGLNATFGIDEVHGFIYSTAIFSVLLLQESTSLFLLSRKIVLIEPQVFMEIIF